MATTSAEIVSVDNTDVACSRRAEPLKFLDLQAQHAEIREEIASSLARVMEAQQFILGPEVEAFEREVAHFLGVTGAVGCASGSDALILALRALSIGPGDEVITTPFTFVATGGAIALTGATPVFVDIDPRTYNIDTSLIAEAITERTKALMPVHLFGLTADMEIVRKIAQDHQLAIIEDAAQAIGARHRNRSIGEGSIGCLSFFPSKNLGGAGDGGMVVADNPRLIERLRMLRAHGSRKKYYAEIIGSNSRLDAIQAAILRVKLRYLADWTRRRQQSAFIYTQLFEECGLMGEIDVPYIPAGHGHVFNQYTIRCQSRDRLKEFLKTRGVPTEIYYPTPLHLQPAFSYLKYAPGRFPAAEKAATEVLSLPLHSHLRQEDQAAVVRAIAEFYKSPLNGRQL